MSDTLKQVENKNIMKRVVCLYRVSTKKQTSEIENDIPMQYQACHDFSEQQNGWVIVKEFYEKGISGYKVSAQDRDALQDIRKMADNKEFDILLVFMYDRLGRIASETPFVVEALSKLGIEIWSTTQGRKRLETHADTLTNFIDFWHAEQSSKETSERVAKKFEQMVAAGEYIGGSVPYGYKLVNTGQVNKKGRIINCLTVDPLESDVVRMIFGMVYHEGFGATQIANYLNERDFRTHNGARFQNNTIHRILKNKLYIGYKEIKSAISEKQEHWAIVDEKIFYRVREIVEQRNVKAKKQRTVSLRNKGNALLSGNIFCGHCGHRMHYGKKTETWKTKDGTKKKRETMDYICYARNNKLCNCDGNSRYKADRIEQAVCEVIRELFNRIVNTPEQKVIELRYKKQLETAKRQKRKYITNLQECQKKLTSLQLAITDALTGDGLFSPEDLAEAMNTVKDKIKDYEYKLAGQEKIINDNSSVVKGLSDQFQEFKGWGMEFDNAPINQKKMILSALIKRIEVHRGYEINIEFDMAYKQFTGADEDKEIGIA